MKRIILLNLMILTLLIFITGTAAAAEEGTAFEFGDGHWIYFGPSQAPEWTALRKMPLKRTLQQSIRGDALRHYEMPQFTLPESCITISFQDSSALRTGKPSRALVDDERALPRAVDAPQGVFELPESGMTIEFPPREDRSLGEEPILARHGEDHLR